MQATILLNCYFHTPQFQSSVVPPLKSRIKVLTSGLAWIPTLAGSKGRGEQISIESRIDYRRRKAGAGGQLGRSRLFLNLVT
jgi:hypothetical protein